MKKHIAALVIIPTLALTACVGQDDPETQDTAAQETPESTGSGLTQEEWFELCGPEGEAPADPLCEADKNIDPVGDDAEYNDMYGYVEPAGEWFTFTTTDADDFLEEWDVRIDSAEITSLLEDADDNPDYYSGDDLDAPEKVDAEPTEGNEFLRVDYTVKNTLDSPSSLSLEASVLFTDGEEYAALGDDQLYTENLTDALDNPTGYEQNPGTETQGVFVIEIPEGSDVEGIILRDVYIGSNAEVVAAVDL